MCLIVVGTPYQCFPMDVFVDIFKAEFGNCFKWNIDIWEATLDNSNIYRQKKRC